MQEKTKYILSEPYPEELVTPLTTTTRLGGVTTLQDNNKQRQ
jgi:hypothetical protein